MKTFKIVSIAVFTALIFVVTAYLFIPVGIGYINFGDAFILLASTLFGPLAGALCGAIGGTLADLVNGYALYAPFTLIIKAVEGFLCGIIIRKTFAKQKLPVWRIIVAYVSASLTMVLGYFITNSILTDIPTALTVGVPNDLVQAALSVAAALVLTFALKKVSYINKLITSSIKTKNDNDVKKN